METKPEKIRILLAEDHAVVREGTRRLLESQPDFTVVGESGNGEEAVRLAGELRPDVVIMDVAMPRMTGIEATKRIKQAYPSVAVLVLTGYDYEEYIFALLEAGAAGYLLKDISGEDLVSGVRAVFNGEPALHPAVLRKVVNRLRVPAAKAGEKRPLEVLSEREMEVLRLAARSMTNKEIADNLGLSQRTVQAHLRTVFDKLAVGSRSEAVLHGLRRGWFTMDDLP